MAAALVDPGAAKLPVPSVGVPGAGLKGLVEGVGREVLGWSEEEDIDIKPPGAAEGEKREGRVPARARRVDVWEADAVSGMAWLKSGKLSPLGDSGMVSRNGVELPLVGGPHICGVKPSWACISRALGSTLANMAACFRVRQTVSKIADRHSHATGILSQVSRLPPRRPVGLMCL